MKKISKKLHNISILIVDDDQGIIDAMEMILSRLVDKVFIANDGKEGIELFKTKNPDIIITDIRMPVLTGLEMAKEIRSLSAEQPIAILSAHSDTDLLLESIDIGVDKYFLKPLKVDELKKWVIKIAKQASMKQALKIHEENIHFIIDHNPDGICMIDNDKLSYLNKPLLKLMNLSSFYEFSKQDVCLSSFFVNENGLRLFNNLAEFKSFLLSHQGKDSIVNILAPDDVPSNISYYNMFVKLYEEINRIIIVFTDITSIEKERSMLKIQATTDALTQIPNRMYFDLYLSRQITSAKRENTIFSLIMFDIDDFKLINDTYGHPVGDKVLIELTSLVSSHIRENDFFARWGGEEFIILIRSNGNESVVLAQKIAQTIRSHHFADIGKLTCSFGTTLYRKDDTSDSLIQRVDKALYSAKKAGKDCVKFIEE